MFTTIKECMIFVIFHRKCVTAKIWCAMVVCYVEM